MIKALFQIAGLAPITQYQDSGRKGYLHNGFSHSGAMDSMAFAMNNALLGNTDEATQLEIAPGGLQLNVLADCQVALTGAYLNVVCNDEPLINFAVNRLSAGDKLRFGFSRHGQYAYLGVVGGFAVTPFLDSTATTKRLSIFPGGQLNVGSILSGKDGLELPAAFTKRNRLPDYQATLLEVYPTYQYADFSPQVRQQFIRQAFTVSATDRMGTRLQAEQAVSYNGGELLSEGIIPGAIQVPPDGNPIVLQKDAQSIGGYPKIGVLTEASRSLLAQKSVGKKVGFRFIK